MAKVEINTNTKAKLKSQTKIYGNQGKAGRFRRKNGEIRHIHVWRKEKIMRGKFRTPENNTVRLETRTQGQFDNAVCTNTIALRLPLILIRKVFRRTHTDKTKSLIESLYHHEASKTHTLRKKEQRTKAAKALSACESCDHRSNRRLGSFDVLSSSSSVHTEEWKRRLSTERKLPEKY